MIAEKLISDIYQSLKLPLIGVITASIAFFSLFYDHVNNAALTIWFLSVLTITLFRYTTMVKFHKDRSLFTTEKWHQIFSLGVVLSAVSWGFVPILFFAESNYLYQMIIIIIMTGISAGALSSLSHLYKNIQLFLLISLIPLILELLIQETSFYNNIAILAILFLILLLYIAKKFNRNYTDAADSLAQYKIKKFELMQSEQKFETIFRYVPIGVFFYNTDLIIQEANQEFLDFIEAPRDYIIGLDMNTLKDKVILPTLRASIEGLSGFYEGEYTTNYTGKSIWISMNTNPLKASNEEVIGGVGIVSDITQRINQQKDIEHKANYDSLTDLPNRTNILNDINREITRFKRHEIIFGIIFLDLDHFKNINDSLGHSVGDKLLIEATARFKDSTREEDIIGRIGGDEFVVILPDLSKDEKEAMLKAEIVAEKIHKIFENPFKIDGHRLNISLSIGIALISKNEQLAEDVLKHADIAMYQSKKDGRNTTRFYQKYMELRAKRYLEIENELRNAIAKNEMEIYYQPIIEIATSRIIGAEALLRWKNKKLGQISPDEFIPIAEESGLIFNIGRWVLINAIQQFMQWQRKFNKITMLNKIAVNVSVKQFNNPEFLGQIEQIIKQTEIEPHNLEFELTESIIVKNAKEVKKKMKKLREFGINLSIDDFGTGYSSLSYLKKLPFTTLKIDKSFTQDIQYDADDKDLINTILAIAKNFNLEVIVEGVETYEQYKFVNEKNATYIQGFYCSKPLDKNSFEDMLQKNKGICTKLVSQK
ncbi:MAG: EAL domain-containing protein [Sulfurospirillaceae bacterium]|nr:EAL domain-containing protein [Sulfurospirillaceae bacterium]